MATYRLLVCCGTGIATSVQVANKLKDLLKARGVRVDTAECKAIELSSRASAFRPHAIVSTTQINPKSLPVRAFQGLPFLTGIGAEDAANDIAAYLKSQKA